MINIELNNDKIIEDRVNMGIGKNSQIIALLNDISLGSHYFKIAKALRESILINGILFNSEAWYNLTEKNIKKLEEVDEALLRTILNAPSKTPLPALYLELGCLPIRCYIMMRRLNFLHEMLSLDSTQLLSKFLQCQSNNPKNGDWVLTINDDC